MFPIHKRILRCLKITIVFVTLILRHYLRKINFTLSLLSSVWFIEIYIGQLLNKITNKIRYDPSSVQMWSWDILYIRGKHANKIPFMTSQILIQTVVSKLTIKLSFYYIVARFVNPPIPLVWIVSNSSWRKYELEW